MSRNFELLANISNEKDLFETLDGWEDAGEVSVNAELEAELDAKESTGTHPQSSLPDVFQTTNYELDAVELVSPDLCHDTAPIPEPKPENAHVETQGAALEGRFPISRNPVTRLDSGETKLQESSPSQKEKAHHEQPSPRPLRPFESGGDESIAAGPGRKARTRNGYKDPRREAIAHEEEFKLVQRIFLATENCPRMVLFSGFERNHASVSICIRAGEILAAQAEGPVCLVDMGFGAPLLHEYCGVQNNRGLAEAIAESSPIQEFAQQLSPANLWVIPSGRGASQLNFAKVADRLRARMEELRKTFRFVIIHSGSLWLNADEMLISKWTDGVVLILEANSTRRDAARRIKENLAAANARVLGVVLNNRTYPIPETLYSRL